MDDRYYCDAQGRQHPAYRNNVSSYPSSSRGVTTPPAHVPGELNYRSSAFESSYGPSSSAYASPVALEAAQNSQYTSTPYNYNSSGPAAPSSSHPSGYLQQGSFGQGASQQDWSHRSPGSTEDRSTPRTYQRRTDSLRDPPDYDIQERNQFRPHHGPRTSSASYRQLATAVEGQSLEFGLDQQYGPHSTPRSHSGHSRGRGFGSSPGSRGPPRRNDSAQHRFRQLEDGYSVHHAKFFGVGRVFHMIENSPGGNDPDDKSSRWTYNSYGQRIYTKARRFVVVRTGGRSCLVVPMTTYDGQGVAKLQVKKSDHCIAYSGATPPSLGPGELAEPPEMGMQAFPIRIDPDDRQARLDPMSRIDFSKPLSVDFYVEVKNFGMVNPKSMAPLVSQFRNVMDPERMQRTTTPGPSASASSRHRRALDAMVRGGLTPQEAADYVNDFIRALRKNRSAARDSQSDSEKGQRSEDET